MDEQAAQGRATSAQGPEMNRALAYLDKVKAEFQEKPEVYDRFVDTMKEYQEQTIDVPGLIARAKVLFQGHPQLLEGLATFLPPGYTIESG